MDDRIGSPLRPVLLAVVFVGFFAVEILANPPGPRSEMTWTTIPAIAGYAAVAFGIAFAIPASRKWLLHRPRPGSRRQGDRRRYGEFLRLFIILMPPEIGGLIATDRTLSTGFRLAVTSAIAIVLLPAVWIGLAVWFPSRRR